MTVRVLRTGGTIAASNDAGDLHLLPVAEMCERLLKMCIVGPEAIEGIPVPCVPISTTFYFLRRCDQ